LPEALLASVGGDCFLTGKQSSSVALWGRSY
jgi:hypothetical protein